MKATEIYNQLLTLRVYTGRLQIASPGPVHLGGEKMQAMKSEPDNIRGFRTIERNISPAAGHTVFDFLMHLTDAGNAERFAYYAKDLARYCEPWKTWILWDGKRWTRDAQNRITKMAKQNIRLLHTQISMMEDDRERAAIAKHLAGCESKGSITNSLELAKGEIPIVPDELDAGPYLLNLENGIYNLETGELGDFEPGRFLTKLAGTHYDEKASCPAWQSFLLRILAGNEHLMTFLQKAVGYSLTGDTTEQSLIILHGSGANGKSTFLATVAALLGDYATKTPITTFLQKRDVTISNDIAALKGARFVSATEAGEGQRLAEPLIKELTGGDQITARFLYAEYFTYRPEFKLFIGTNHKPVIAGTDYAIWRRIRLIPFEVTIPPEDQDPDLLEKLKAELPGILNWALEGYRLWKAERLGMPEEIAAAVASYREEMDSLAAFFDECCILERAKMAKNTDLYHSYTQWAEQNGEHAMTNRRMSAQLRERAYDSVKRKDGLYWLGIGLLEQET